jgi:hypothetical protein
MMFETEARGKLSASAAREKLLASTMRVKTCIASNRSTVFPFFLLDTLGSSFEVAAWPFINFDMVGNLRHLK